MNVLTFLVISVLAANAERYTLDISKEVDKRFYSRIEYGRDEGTSCLFFPRKGVIITGLCDDDNPIWTGGEFDRLRTFRINYLSGIPKVACLRLYSRGEEVSIYYKVQCDEYDEITREEYDKTLERLFTDRRLNIKSINPTLFKSDPFEERPTTAKIYGPRGKYRIIAVEDDATVLWEARTETARCDYVVLHGDQTSPQFIHMFTRNNGFFEMLYFTKRDGMWASIREDVFNSELCEADGHFDTKL